MNDEIKEMLDELKEYASGGMSGLYPAEQQVQHLLDYITNLQQENERLEHENFCLREYLIIHKKSIPNELVKDKTFIEMLDMPTYEDYKSRCEKAIEYNKEIVDNYLEEDDCEYCDGRYATAKHNLNILQNGSDSQ